jgi:N-methylhydantoinase A
VIVGDTPVTAEALAATIAKFHEQHDFEFGYSNPEDQVELIATHLEAYGELPRVSPVTGDGRRAGVAEARRSRPVCFRSTGWVDTAVYDRGRLTAGATIHGPAIIEEREATTIVGPQATVEVDDLLNLILRAED